MGLSLAAAHVVPFDLGQVAVRNGIAAYRGPEYRFAPHLPSVVSLAGDNNRLPVQAHNKEFLPSDMVPLLSISQGQTPQACHAAAVQFLCQLCKLDRLSSLTRMKL